MPDPSLDSNGDNRVRLGRGSPPSMPRWVKMFGLITGIVLVALFVILHLADLGGMGSHH